MLLAATALVALTGPAGAQAPGTTTPIEHLIVVVGENLSFDNLFATYEPRSGSILHNLLSEGIINRDGSPGRISPRQRSALPKYAIDMR